MSERIQWVLVLILTGVLVAGGIVYRDSMAALQDETAQLRAAVEGVEAGNAELMARVNYLTTEVVTLQAQVGAGTEQPCTCIMRVHVEASSTSKARCVR